MKRNEGEDKDGNRHKDEDEDGDLSCTTVLLLVSIADEEGGQDEAPTIPAIYHHYNYPSNLHHHHNPRVNGLMQLYLLVKEGFHLEGVGPAI